MAYWDILIDGFAYFSLFPYIIYDHLKCVTRFRATLYIINDSFSFNFHTNEKPNRFPKT